MSETTDVQEVPESPAEAPEDAPATDETGGQSEAAQEPADEAEEVPEDPQEPEVVNDENGQHVNMPDGSVVQTRNHPYPVTNSEWEKYELTHSGDQARYSLKPGDLGYTPYSDPSVPNSWLAKQVEIQLASFGERVLTDPDARPSVTWDALQPGYQGALEDAIATGGGSGKVEA